MSDLEALGALLDTDRWIDRVTSQRDHLPEAEDLSAVESVLRAQAGEVRDAEAAAAPVRAQYDEASTRADRIQRRRRELETALAASTAGARDLAAMQHELDSVRVQCEIADEEALQVLARLEELETGVDGLRQSAKETVARREQLRTTVTELRASLEDEVASLRAARSLCASAVPTPLLERYERALARVGVSGASRVVQGRCDGCRIALAPLDLDRVKALSDGEFMECPSCGRLLLR